VNYLLDTCVLSDARKSDAPAGLIHWLQQISELRLFVPSLVFGEIQKGISALPDSRKKFDLQAWLDEALIPRFQGRILDMDIETALEWGVLAGESRRAGRPAPLADALIAATALRHHLTLVTRNTDDFQAFPVRLFNPWGEDL